MRLFVAIELPQGVRTAIEDLTSRARTALPKARWVAAANLHLTLAFLGEVEESALPRLATGLDSTLGGGSPMTLRLSRSGCFPASGRARVAWIGFEESPPLVRLHGDVVAGLRSAIGYEPERRAFHPHLTVARCTPPWPAAAGRRWTETLQGSLGEPFRVDSVSLMRSRLNPAGAVHSNVHRFALRGAA